MASAASQWFCNSSVYTEPSVINADDSVIVLYGSVIVLSIQNMFCIQNRLAALYGTHPSCEGEPDVEEGGADQESQHVGGGALQRPGVKIQIEITVF